MPSARPPLAARFASALVAARLPALLAALSAALCLPSLAIGFHLDDYVHRYMLSARPGASELLRVYESPFGIANGVPADNLWQIEHGYAPWWTHPDLLVSLFRPLSELSHRLDAALFPDSAPLQHLHSVLWLALLVWLTTRFYRALLGPTTLAGLAALLYAVDHAHGFAAGWIANRNALIAAALGSAALLAYVQARARRGPLLHALSLGLLGAALLAGESSVAVLGYMLGHALFVDRAPRASRALAWLPHALLVVIWRAGYVRLGHGARHSGLYLDPLGEPLAFALAALERVPMLVLGQLALPPAETVMFVSGGARVALLALAALVCTVALWLLVPVLRRDGHARMFGLGALGALVLASSTHPNNRLLFYVGLGAMPLLSACWHAAVEPAPDGPRPGSLARGAIAGLVGFRLVGSPLLLPLTACSVALTSPATTAARSLLEAAPREVVVVSAPDYFYIKLVPVLAALEGRRAPGLFALSFGDVPLRVERTAAHALEVHYQGGLLASPLLELYRTRAAIMPTHTRVAVPRVTVQVTALDADGRVAAARFDFREPLGSQRFVAWDGARFAPFALPAVGESVQVRGAALRFGL